MSLTVLGKEWSRSSLFYLRSSHPWAATCHSSIESYNSSYPSSILSTNSRGCPTILYILILQHLRHVESIGRSASTEVMPKLVSFCVRPLDLIGMSACTPRGEIASITKDRHPSGRIHEIHPIAAGKIRACRRRDNRIQQLSPMKWVDVFHEGSAKFHHSIRFAGGCIY